MRAANTKMTSPALSRECVTRWLATARCADDKLRDHGAPVSIAVLTDGRAVLLACSFVTTGVVVALAAYEATTDPALHLPAQLTHTFDRHKHLYGVPLVIFAVDMSVAERCVDAVLAWAGVYNRKVLPVICFCTHREWTQPCRALILAMHTRKVWLLDQLYTFFSSEMGPDLGNAITGTVASRHVRTTTTWCGSLMMVLPVHSAASTPHARKAITTPEALVYLLGEAVRFYAGEASRDKWRECVRAEECPCICEQYSVSAYWE